MEPFLEPPLQAGNAAAAIVVVEGRYLLQLRDDLPHIWYPGHWGFFGGSVEPGEDESEALRRELFEELELEFAETRLFTRFTFDLRNLGLQRYVRSYYEIKIGAADLTRLVLHEGAQMQSVPGDAALAMKLVPYDGFALFLHYQQKRLAK
jgi:8-oxo-dGTP pyrophosphatase MutT (NUDIX family)